MLDELAIYNLSVKYPNTVDLVREVERIARADAIENYIAEQEKFWKENKKVCNTLAKSAKKNGMINMSFFHDGQVSAFEQIIRRLEEQKHKLKEQKLCSNGKTCKHLKCNKCGTTHFMSECDYGKEQSNE